MAAHRSRIHVKSLDLAHSLPASYHSSLRSYSVHGALIRARRLPHLHVDAHNPWKFLSITTRVNEWLNVAYGAAMSGADAAHSGAQPLCPDSDHVAVDSNGRPVLFPDSATVRPAQIGMFQLKTSSAFQPSFICKCSNDRRYRLNTKIHSRLCCERFCSASLPHPTVRYKRIFLRRRRWMPLNCFGRFRRSFCGRLAIRNFSCGRSFSGDSTSRSNS